MTYTWTLKVSVKADTSNKALQLVERRLARMEKDAVDAPVYLMQYGELKEAL